MKSRWSPRTMLEEIARGAGAISFSAFVPTENFAQNLDVIAALIRRETPDVVAWLAAWNAFRRGDAV